MEWIEGLESAISKLDALDKKMKRKVIRKGLRAGGKVLQASSKAEAPEVSGRTKRNVKVRAAKSKKDVIAIAVGVSEKDYAGEAFYAAFVLFGHRVGSKKLGDARTKVPPNDWLKRAFDRSADSAANKAIETWTDLTNQELP